MISGSTDNGELKRIAVRSTAEQIAEQLRSAVFLGRIVAGEQLSEVELASQFGVSRGPVREAVQRLMQEGLLTRTPNHGVFVVAIGRSDIQDIYMIRNAIEFAAAEQILAGDVDRAVERLLERCQLMQEAADAGDASALTSADLAFHAALVDEADSVRLARVHGTLLIETRICMTQLEVLYDPLSAMVQEHIDIVEALRDRDRDRVRRRIYDHMQTAVDLLANIKPS